MPNTVLNLTKEKTIFKNY